MIDYQATGISDNNTWMGPFLVCPENEVVDAFEVNFSFPSGICGFDSKGKKRIGIVSGKFSTVFMVLVLAGRAGRAFTRCVNGLGFTERFNLASPGWSRSAAGAGMSRGRTTHATRCTGRRYVVGYWLGHHPMLASP
jgi:hypothetical protein